MKLDIKSYFSTRIRARLAEFIVSEVARGILTTKYPPEILEEEFFNIIPKEEKDFLKKYWTTFDIFKPIFEIIDEIPVYEDFILYEVKSKVITEKNQRELENPIIRLSLNQKQFLDESKKLGIAVKFFLVFFLKDWEVQYNEFDIDNLSAYTKPNSVWNEERMKRIKSSKLSQFWNDLFPDRVLYRIDEKELEKEEKKQSENYLKEIVRTPLNDFEKKMLIERAKKKNKPTPKFLEEEHYERAEYDKIKNGKRIKIGEDYLDRVQKIKETFSNAYEPWEKEEEDRLRELFSEESKIKEISKILKRQPGAIKSRLKKIGLL
ncbi:MAG: hypothetical protein V1660_02190 [archaeon]